MKGGWLYIMTDKPHGKTWRRAWKINLIRSQKPDWLDLYETLNG